MIIAILTGGDSSEFGISVKSGSEISQWLKKGGYSSYLVTIKGKDWKVEIDGTSIPLDKDIFGFKLKNKTIRFDYAWNIIHGTPGENGLIQGYLDMMKIPYNCSGTLSSALTFNKYVANTYLKQFGILTAESVLIKKGKVYDIEDIIEKVSLPCIVKPNNGGSSFGTTKVTNPENMKKAIDDAFHEDREVIIETFVKGTEVTCGVLKTKKESILFPVTEIVPRNEIFDFKAKYEGMSEEITPARLNKTLTSRCQALASEIYDYTNCKGIVRVDFIIKGNQLYFLELNSIPGMSRESIIPQQIRAMDMKVEDILAKVIEDTSE